MAFKHSQEIVYGVNSACIRLKGQHVMLRNMKKSHYVQVYDPMFIADLLSIEELKRYVNISTMSDAQRIEVENVIVRDKVVEVMGHKGLEVDIGITPAGVIHTLSSCIFSKSVEYLKNPDLNYLIHSDQVTYVEQMCVMVAYYTNTPYDIVNKLPINEIFKRHAMCAKAFPTVASLVGDSLQE